VRLARLPGAAVRGRQRYRGQGTAETRLGNLPRRPLPYSLPLLDSALVYSSRPWGLITILTCSSVPVKHVSFPRDGVVAWLPSSFRLVPIYHSYHPRQPNCSITRKTGFA